MTGLVRRLVQRFTGQALPAGFTGSLSADEHVVAWAAVNDGGHLVATSHGLWVPGPRRIGWHLVSKATWGSGALAVIEAREVERISDAVLLADLAAQRFALAEPGTLPHAVHQRVTDSIRSRHRRDLPDGGVWFVQRKVPGQDGIVLQVRPDPGTNPATVRQLTTEVAERIREAKHSPNG